MQKAFAIIVLAASVLGPVHASAQEGAAHAPALVQEAVSADAAAQAVARGAAVVDMRGAQAYAQGHLPGAVAVVVTAAALHRAALQTLVSQHGIDLSREVLVVGEPGDAAAMQFAHTLAQYATGRVQWLVGGMAEWQMTGRAMSQTPRQLQPVPQHLVALQPMPAEPRMAGAAQRSTVQTDRSAGLGVVASQL
jgi:3-mercaptopyruvate sulfurtransferase SseA